MRRLLRRPLTWMVIGECVVVVALIVVAWHVVAAATQGGGAAAVAQQLLTTGDAPATPSLTLPSIARPAIRRQLPGLTSAPRSGALASDSSIATRCSSSSWNGGSSTARWTR